jgi:hypothetical protein
MRRSAGIDFSNGALIFFYQKLIKSWYDKLSGSRPWRPIVKRGSIIQNSIWRDLAGHIGRRSERYHEEQHQLAETSTPVRR